MCVLTYQIPIFLHNLNEFWHGINFTQKKLNPKNPTQIRVNKGFHLSLNLYEIFINQVFHRVEKEKMQTCNFIRRDFSVEFLKTAFLPNVPWQVVLFLLL